MKLLQVSSRVRICIDNRDLDLKYVYEIAFKIRESFVLVQVSQYQVKYEALKSRRRFQVKYKTIIATTVTSCSGL